MAENIDTDTDIIKADVSSAVLSDAEFAERLETIARDIQRLERQAVFRIANRLAKAHELFRYRRDEGGFQGWMENRLDYSRSHAYRLLDVNKLTESFPSWDTFGTLSASAIYQLAAPSTPNEVRNEIADRVKAGEKISVTVVTEAIAQAKGKSSAMGVEADGNSSNSDSGSAAAERAADELHDVDEHADEADGDDGGDDERRDDGDHRHADAGEKKAKGKASATAPGDEALVGFTARVLDLKRRIGKHGPLRFAKTSVVGSDLLWLSEFLEALAEHKGCEPASKRKSDIPHKQHKHTLTLEANSTRNERGNRSRHDAGKAGPR